MAEGISVGDAVLRFLGDSTQLDEKFASVGPQAEAAFEPATKAVEDFGDAAEDAGQRTQTSMREARGEVALLGEEFGVHLPRHVRSFIAELPGVGEALQAAFSATAILFVAQAIAQVAEKLTKLTADYLIFTDSLKEAEEGAKRHGQTMTALHETYEKDEEALAKFGKTALEIAAMNVGKLTKAVDDAKASTAKLKGEVLALSEPSFWDKSLNNVTWFFTGYDYLAKKSAQDRANAQNNAADKISESEQDVANKEDALALAKKERDAEALKVFQAHIHAMNEADIARTELRNKQESLEADAENARWALDKKVAEDHVKQVSLENQADIARTELFQKQEQLENDAENARYEMQQKLDEQDVKDAEQDEKLAEAAKKRLQDLKKETSVTFQSLASAWKEAAAPLQQLGSLGEEAFNKLTTGLESAVSAALISNASFGQAMETMTRSVLASIASQALVKSLFYFAEGIAMATNPATAFMAGGYFLAAGEMAAAGAAAGAAAHFMPGGSSSSGGSTAQTHTSGSNTSQSNRSGGSAVGVQAFAEGGLITAPTLALMGESGREAVIPLDDPQAKSALGGVGGGTTHHWHIDGMISSDNLNKVVKQISKAVNNGKVSLTSSNSLRLTKRSA